MAAELAKKARVKHEVDLFSHSGLFCEAKQEQALHAMQSQGSAESKQQMFLS